jgi:predicted peptidase
MRFGIAAASTALSLPSAAEAKKVQPSPPAIEGQTVQAPVAEGGLPYLLFLPKGYNHSGDERWPLVIFLHGSGERGTNIEIVKKHGPPMLVEKNPAFPFIVISPQLPEQSPTVGQFWPVAPLDAILDHALKTWRVDPSRIYLTGLSLGGIATWEWGTTRPERFAALAPVAAFGDPTKACQAKDVPVWAFHGDHDDAVDTRGDFEMIDALKKCGSNPAPRLTIYPNMDHWSWVPAYNDPALWMWLSEQRKPPAAKPPEKLRR